MFLKTANRVTKTNKSGIRGVSWAMILPLCLIITSATHQEQYMPTGYRVGKQLLAGKSRLDSTQSFYYINASSLEKLPAVLRDLSIAINECVPIKKLLDEKGLTVHLIDAICRSFEVAAAVQYHVHDSVYLVQVNSLNRKATDMALATTIIHETMHCILLSINDRARKRETKAVSIVADLGRRINNRKNDFDYNFYRLMNRGEAGQHELMYQLFYPEMISVLQRFAALHNEEDRDSELLMWSGLQHTEAFKNLTEEKKEEIQITILVAKGIDIENH